MKVSIRVSIIALFITLLGLIGALIISTNYFILDNILFKAAQLSFSRTTQQIAGQVQYYLRPLDERVNFSKELIDQKVIDPNTTDKFQKYLLKIIEDNTNLYGAYWGDPQGNLYLVERKGHNKYLSETIKRNVVPPEVMQKTINGHGNITAYNQSPSIFDPRIRPWYLAAEKGKQHVWTLYLFKAFLDENPSMGITSATPVYSSDGKLLGVFGMDMTLDSIAKHIFTLKLSKNTVIFICDDKGQVIASTNTEEISRLNARGVAPKISSARSPHIAISYAYYRQHKQPLFSYVYKKNRYIASYASIPTFIQGNWYVAVVTPELEVIYFLREVVYISVFATLIVLLIGFFLIYTLSSRIARPIMQLTKESEKVSQFDLDSPIKMNSGISEINCVQDAFNSMKERLKAFRYYLPVTLVKQLLEEAVKSQGVKIEKNLVFLFIDINRFTFLPNNLDSKMLLQDLSEYTDMITEVVSQHGGNVDKYLGNGMIAFWNVSSKDYEYITDACWSALCCKTALKDLNQKWKERRRAGFTINIGINTGFAIINHPDSLELLNYTDISDAINLSVRLQELNKIYRTYCIVEESVYQAAKNLFEFRLLDLIVLRGNDQPAYIYELLGEKGTLHFALTENYQEMFKKAFETYREGDFRQAMQVFEQMKTIFTGDTLIDLYLDRCKVLIASPCQDWKGIWIMRME